MDANQEEIRALMLQIDALVEESYTLQRTKASWPRHVEIQAEIMQLCRRASDLHEKPEPYWMKLGGTEGGRADDSKAA